MCKEIYWIRNECESNERAVCMDFFVNNDKMIEVLSIIWCTRGEFLMSRRKKSWFSCKGKHVKIDEGK